MARTLEAAVFDVDGMMLDTREFIFQAYEYTLEIHGHTVPDRLMIAQQIGRSLPDCYEAFAPEGEFIALAETHHNFQAERMQLIKPYDGLLEMLEELKEAGLKLAAFSSRSGSLIPSLQQAGVIEYFDVVVQGNDVKQHKPHPEGLFLALGTMAVAPSAAAMLGDAAVDIQAGKAAGVALTVGVTHGFGSRPELEAAHPDYIVDDLNQISRLLLEHI